jgi:hypothetical protein
MLEVFFCTYVLLGILTVGPCVLQPMPPPPPEQYLVRQPHRGTLERPLPREYDGPYTREREDMEYPEHRRR